MRVPAEAVVTDGEQSFVFVHPPPQRAARLERRKVPSATSTATGRGPQRPGAGLHVVSEGALLLLNAVDSEG